MTPLFANLERTHANDSTTPPAKLTSPLLLLLYPGVDATPATARSGPGLPGNGRALYGAVRTPDLAVHSAPRNPTPGLDRDLEIGARRPVRAPNNPIRAIQAASDFATGFAILESRTTARALRDRLLLEGDPADDRLLCALNSAIVTCERDYHAA